MAKKGMHDAAGKKIAHPADAERRKHKKKKLEQKKKERHDNFEQKMFGRSPEDIEQEIRAIKSDIERKKACKIDVAKIHFDRLSRLETMYEKLRDSIKDKHNERQSREKKSMHVDFDELKIHRKSSIFYHPVNNPYGAPPNGQTVKYRHPDGSVRKEPPSLAESAAPLRDAAGFAADAHSSSDDMSEDDSDEDAEPDLPTDLPSSLQIEIEGDQAAASSSFAPPPRVPPDGVPANILPGMFSGMPSLPLGAPQMGFLAGQPLPFGNSPFAQACSFGAGAPFFGGLPPGLPPMPGGAPPLPAGMPPLPAGLPPVPGGMPPLPPGMPPLPAGMPPLLTGTFPLLQASLSVPAGKSVGVPPLPPGRPPAGATVAPPQVSVFDLPPGVRPPGPPPRPAATLSGCPPVMRPPGPPPSFTAPMAAPLPVQVADLPPGIRPPGPPPRGKAPEAAAAEPKANHAAARAFVPTNLRTKRPSQLAGGVVQVSSASLSQAARDRTLLREAPAVAGKGDIDDAMAAFLEEVG